jgi:hypothetical protein
LARRLYAPFFAKRYAGESDRRVLHDLDNEKKECRIEEIDSRRNLSMFEWLSVAIDQGYIGCQFCMPNFEKQAGK